MKITYEVSSADRMPMPRSYFDDRRHLGFDAAEHQRPFAHYFRPSAKPIQDHVREALLAGKFPSEYSYEAEDAVHRLSPAGYHPMETGWTTTARGNLLIACLTDMPGVTAEMWDWWFGWHGTDTARYKLWHPEAHQFSVVAADRSADRSLTDRQRYVGNVSYVDEYIGGDVTRLAIRFVDPARLGFDERPGTLHVCARIGSSELPVVTGWIVHQVRPTDRGSEMRSRFFLGHPTVLDLPAHSASQPAITWALNSRLGPMGLRQAVSAIAGRNLGGRLGYDLLHHCAAEMNHLADFLPDLFAEFRGTP